MAKFRSNHSQSRGAAVGIWLRLFVMLGLIALMLVFVMGRFYPKSETSQKERHKNYERDYLVPRDSNAEVIHHTYYSIGYKEQFGQAEWVAYVLNRDEIRMPNVPRFDRYLADDAISSGSAEYSDYSGSGYTRGHLAPAGDMAFDEIAMEESFFMSNMSPQVRQFNGGIWRELEESVRDWAYNNERLYITTGPVLVENREYIGRNTRVMVPQYFYKAVVDIDGEEKNGIGFIMPNERSDEPIFKFVVSIDEIESIIGIDLFPGLYNDQEEEVQIESEIDLSQWPINEQRFRLRVEKWNVNAL